MRLRAPGAGSLSRHGRGRRRACGLAATAAFAAAFASVAGCSPERGRRPDLHLPHAHVVVPVRSISMARLVLHVNQTGMPMNDAGAFGGYTPLVFPVAVAVTTFDVYIADAGVNRLYRYDPSVDAMAVIAAGPITPQTRLAASPDGSVVVTSPSGIAQRFDRAGNLVQRIDARLGMTRYDDIVVDPVSGTYLGLDRLKQRIEEIHPLGRSGIVLADSLLPAGPAGIAYDRHVIYVGGRLCGCVVAFDPSGGQRTTLVEDLQDVGPLAAGGGWLAVIDGVQRRLFIHRDGMLRGEPSFDELKLQNPQGMAIVNDTLYIADGAGRRVAVFRLKP